MAPVPSDSRAAVAVIAVHGVGDPPPGSTARLLAAHLQASVHGSDGRSRYSVFEEQPLEVPIPSRWPLDSPPGLESDIAVSAEALARVDLEHGLRRYRTVRLTGTRYADAAGAAREVHVYELDWSDLSRAPGWMLGFLYTLYQLLFHLASLGRKAVVFAQAALQDSTPPAVHRLVNLSARAHLLIERLLPTTIPVLNLFLLAASLPLAVLFFPERWHHAIAIGAAGAAALVLLAGIGYCAGILRTPLVAVLGALAASYAAWHWPEGSRVIIGGLALTIGLVVAYRAAVGLLDRFEERYWTAVPAAATAMTVGLLVAGYVHQRAWTVDTFTALIVSATFAVHALFLLIQVTWAALFIATIFVCLGPPLARGCGLAGDDPHTRALRTGRIGVLTSATFFVLATSVLWAAFLAQVRKPIEALRDISFDPPFGLLYPKLADTSIPELFSAHADKLYLLTTGNLANTFLAAIGVALLVAIAAMLPSAIAETSPPDAGVAARDATRLGRWLDRAFRALTTGERLIILAWLALAAGYDPCARSCEWIRLGDAGNEWVTRLGVLLAGAVPVALLLRHQLPTVVRNVMDIALDVSNWLKERPWESNPRGRILARYLGLLAAIGALAHYRSIVIVSHSQGTVITADLLRLLARHPALAASVLGGAPPGIRLLTAGSPLRQLYAERFPHQYGWAHGANGEGPDPAKLFGLVEWRNVYCTGDYVGRALWKVPEAGDPGAGADALPQTPAVPHDDICLGAGAHTHYFDAAAPQTGRLVDAMITAR